MAPVRGGSAGAGREGIAAGAGAEGFLAGRDASWPSPRTGPRAGGVGPFDPDRARRLRAGSSSPSACQSPDRRITPWKGGLVFQASWRRIRTFDSQIKCLMLYPLSYPWSRQRESNPRPPDYVRRSATELGPRPTSPKRRRTQDRQCRLCGRRRKLQPLRSLQVCDRERADTACVRLSQAALWWRNRWLLAAVAFPQQRNRLACGPDGSVEEIFPSTRSLSPSASTITASPSCAETPVKRLDDILVGDHDEIAGAGIGFHAGDDRVLLRLGERPGRQAAGRAPRRSRACGRRRHSRPCRGNGNNGWTVSARSWRRVPKSACRCGRPAGGPARRGRAASSSRRRRNWPDRAAPGDIAWRISTTCPPSRNKRPAGLGGGCRREQHHRQTHENETQHRPSLATGHIGMRKPQRKQAGRGWHGVLAKGHGAASDVGVLDEAFEVASEPGGIAVADAARIEAEVGQQLDHFARVVGRVAIPASCRSPKPSGGCPRLRFRTLPIELWQ